GGKRRITLSAETTRALREITTSEGTTQFMTLLAVWQLLLARYSGQDDVLVGTPTAGRTRVELEPLVGFFVNTLVLRTDLCGDPGFRELLGRVREATLGAYQHQDLPFERLVEELAPERSLTHSPLFQVMFSFDNASGFGAGGGGGGERAPLLEGVSLSPLSHGRTVAKFDMQLTVEEQGEHMAGVLVYRAELFEDATIERMLRHFRALADQVAADPDRRIGEFDLLTPEERAQLLDASLTRRDHPRTTVHELFAEQVARTPDAAALVFAGETLTYAALDARANRLAHLLRRRGVGPEVTVGISLPRTPEMVVALLAVLRAGGAYVPLDPAYPQERLGYMIEDAGARLVLTGSALADRLPEGIETLALDRLAEELNVLPSDAPETGVLPENLSHVIFTSGSTGRPKGVMIRHSSTVVLLHWLRENVSDEERSAVLGSTSINFDVSIAEIFGTLCWGGTLFLVENALELASFPDRERIVYASMVPTAAAELLRMGTIPAGVRTLNLGGEALPNDLAQALYATGTVEKVGNLYGPTEDTTYSTYSLVERGGEQVYVGRPVTNTRAYVLLDGGLQPVPLGVVGELYLSGDGLARGYASRPDLTAERFLPDPFGEPGARMYRVMDRVRWRPDGELEYFGRTDFQVKVRGFRIELGEIETALRTHGAVRDAVVLVREDAPGDRRLVAYVVAAEGAETPAAAELRAHLRQRVPEYMIPGAFVALPELPLTPNGKVDRRALPAPEHVGDDAAEYLAPRDTVELELAGVWEEVLGASPVGVRDNFFALGGHSLLAVRLMARIETVLGARLPLATLFSAPTVESLAAILRRESDGPDASPLVPIRASGGRPPLFFVHPVGGDVLCYAPLNRHLGADQPFYGLRSRALTGGAADATVEAMASDYVAVLREAQRAGPYRLGGWSMGGVVAFEMARQLEAAGERVEVLALVDSMIPALAGRSFPQSEAVLVRTFAADLGLPLDDALLSAGGDAEADTREYVRRVLEAARSAGLVPPDLGFEQVWHLYGIFRANLRAMYEYRPGGYGGRVTLLRAAEHDPAEGEILGWESVAAGGVETRVVPGNHFTLVREPHAAELASALAEFLE
ncbi:MAG: amino acid adenylation domain-containing protein, partial [Gemmatimonadetes bacterium]|nr:amino acid adenylation domain-containing protein [Gemmatimonadota bacterium]